jgi:hypothetical protein
VLRNLADLSRIVSLCDHFVLLQGDTSEGKTSLITHITDNRCVRVNNHEHTDIQEYIGSYTSDTSGKLVFKLGVLAEAMVAGSWIILDELNLAPNDVLEALNRVLDDNRELIIHKTQETIVAAPGFRAFGTQNPAETPLSCLQEPFPRAPLRPAAAGGAGDNSGEAMRAAAELQPEDGRCWTSYRCTGGAARPSPAGRDSSAGRASSLCGTCSGDSTSSARMLMLTRGTVQLRAWCEHWHQTQSLLRSNRAGVRWLSHRLWTCREESPGQSKVGGIAA